MERKMDTVRVLLKAAMWFLIAGFGCNFIMQTISYSFYKRAKKCRMFPAPRSLFGSRIH